MAVAFRYVPDKVVADPADLDPHFDMHVLIIDRNGYASWHRYQAQSGEQFTACDDPQRVKSRDIIEHRIPQYGGAMCRDGCFSKSELRECDSANAEAERKSDERWGH